MLYFINRLKVYLPIKVRYAIFRKLKTEYEWFILISPHITPSRFLALLFEEDNQLPYREPLQGKKQ